MMLDILMFIALGLVALSAILGWLFVALYSRVRWWATPEGRHLMKFTIVLSLMYSMTLLFQVVQPKRETRLVLSIALFAWTAWELGTRVLLHLRAVKEAREEARHLSEAG